MSQTLEFKLPSRIESVEEAAQRAGEFLRHLGFNGDFIYAVDLAIRESVANAVKHGNLLDVTKNVVVRMFGSGGRLEITVRDFGKGFAVADVPDPTDRENLLKAAGRGILFMRSFMDEVEWLEADGGGMIVKMSKMQ